MRDGRLSFYLKRDSDLVLATIRNFAACSTKRKKQKAVESVG